jgi:hypothetical protein
MKNGKLPGYNRIGNRESPGTFLGVPLKRLNISQFPHHNMSNRNAI